MSFQWKLIQELFLVLQVFLFVFWVEGVVQSILKDNHFVQDQKELNYNNVKIK